MYNDEQMTQITLEHAQRISALEQGYTSMDKRIDENDRITTGIHKLAANMENLTTEVKRLAEKLENGLREQGKRIGDAESKIISLASFDDRVKEIGNRVETLEKEPGQKWKSMIAQIISIATTALITGLIMKLT